MTRLAGMLMVVVTALSMWSLPSLQAQTPPAEAGRGVENLASCLADDGTLLALLLLDQSASLRRTDPDGARVDGSAAVIASLEALAGLETPDVDVWLSIAGFGESYQEERAWTRVSPATKPDLLETARSFATRDRDLDTDYFLALQGAQAAFAQQQGALSSDTAERSCKVLLWFTDGEYSIDSGQGKDYAVGVDDPVELIRRGRDGVCRPGGIADQLRAQEVVTIAVALAFENEGIDGVDDMAFLEAVAKGEGVNVGSYTCGETDSRSWGEFVAVADIDDLVVELETLIQNLTGKDDAECERDGDLAIVVVDASIDQLSVLVDAEGESIRLTTPLGESAEFAIGIGATGILGSSSLAVTALGSFLKIEISPVEGSRLQDGDWVIDGVAATCLSFVDGGVLGRVSGSTLVRGEAAKLQIELGSPLGRVIDPGTLQGVLEVEATATDPQSGRRDELKVTLSGSTFEFDYTPASSLTSPVVEFVITTTLKRRDGQTLSNSATSTVALRPPVLVIDDAGQEVVPPRLVTRELRFPSISGVGSSGASLIFEPGDVDARVCVSALTVATAPEDSLPVVLTAPEPCLTIPAGEGLKISTEVSVGSAANGSVVGSVDVEVLAKEVPVPVTYSVPVSVDLRKRVDIETFWFLFVIMLFGGVAIPVGIYILVDRWRTRLGDLRGVRVAQIDVIVGSLEPIERVETGGVVGFDPDDWTFLSGVHARSVDLADGVLRLHPGGLGAPTATIEVRDRFAIGNRGMRSSGEMRDAAIDAGLHGVWAFAVVVAATDDQDHDVVAARGKLTMLTLEDRGDWAGEARATLLAVERDLPLVLPAAVAAWTEVYGERQDPSLLQRPSFDLDGLPREVQQEDVEEPNGPVDPGQLL